MQACFALFQPFAFIVVFWWVCFLVAQHAYIAIFSVFAFMSHVIFLARLSSIRAAPLVVTKLFCTQQDSFSPRMRQLHCL